MEISWWLIITLESWNFVTITYVSPNFQQQVLKTWSEFNAFTVTKSKNWYNHITIDLTLPSSNNLINSFFYGTNQSQWQKVKNKGKIRFSNIDTGYEVGSTNSQIFERNTGSWTKYIKFLNIVSLKLYLLRRIFLHSFDPFLIMSFVRPSKYAFD